MNILQSVTCINEATGGPAVSVTELAASLARLGHRSRVVALDYPELGPPRSASPATVILHRVPFAARRVADWSPGLRRLLASEAKHGADLVHNHGLWLLPNRYAMLAARDAKIPLVISPRGMLEPWARRRGRAKKWIAWKLLEGTNVRSAAAFHATSAAEAKSIRESGIHAPIAVIPNGVNASMLAGHVPARSLVPSVGDARYVCFMSRLHPKKGIEMLLQSWKMIRQDHPQLRLLVAGPDLTGHRVLLERLAAELGIMDSVVFSGPIDGERKAAALTYAEVFVLPSFSENFGIVIAEALAHGAPVITTTGTPWRSLEESHCGWWIEPTVEALVTALRAALSLSPRERLEYAERARALVRETCSWDAIATDTATFYRWICEDGCRPSQAPAFLAE